MKLIKGWEDPEIKVEPQVLEPFQGGWVATGYRKLMRDTKPVYFNPWTVSKLMGEFFEEDNTNEQDKKPDPHPA